MNEAVQIIQSHYDSAWRKRIMADHYAMTGRKTKAKDRERDIAEAIAAELETMMAELREAGYDVKD